MIQFTIAQINELLAELGKIPYAYSAPLIDGIKKIANEQLAEQAKQTEEPVAVGVTPVENEK